MLMTLSPELIALASYLAGEFDNREQAFAEPAWYVHLRLWMRPVQLFTEDSITLFAEQANIVNLNKPYRPRILRIQRSDSSMDESLRVYYYMLKDPDQVRGAGCQPGLLNTLTSDQMELLPNCTLAVQVQKLSPDAYHFSTLPVTDDSCRFTFQGATYQVFLGFKAQQQEFLSYDKGIDPNTGKATWGALLGPYRFTKRQDFSAELPI